MKNLQYYITEGLDFKKGVWTQIDLKKLTKDQKSELEYEIFGLISTAYKPLGGHVNFKNSKDVFSDKDVTYWKGLDLDGADDLDVIVFGKKTKYGIKLTGVGHDDEKLSKQEYLNNKAASLSKIGYYNEVSGKLAEILLQKYKIDAVTDKDDIEKVIEKSIEFLGKHPDGITAGFGWYSRILGGHQHIKILLGKPKGI